MKAKWENSNFSQKHNQAEFHSKWQNGNINLGSEIFSLFEKQNGKSSTLVKIEIVVKLANSDIAAQAIAILDNKVGRL